MSTTTARDTARQDTARTDQAAEDQTRPEGVRRHEVVIVGGGTAGITVAAQLTKGLFNHRDVAIIEPSDKHYYQPAWTLVGGGTYDKQATVRSEASVIPRGA